MDRGDAFDRSWEEEIDGFDPFDHLDVDGGGDDGPPEPPSDPPRRGQGGPPAQPPRPDDIVFHPAWTAGALTLIALFAALNVFTIQLGARGGAPAVALVVGLFAMLFFVPFVGGAWWFGRIQARDR